MLIKYWFVKPWGDKGSMVYGENIGAHDAVKLLGIELDSAWGAIELTKAEYDRKLKMQRN
jgi:hypothetical protein